jgi:hypothetical protein
VESLSASIEAVSEIREYLDQNLISSLFLYSRVKNCKTPYNMNILCSILTASRYLAMTVIFHPYVVILDSGRA